MTFEFLCAGLNFETSDLITFWLSGGQLLRPSGLILLYKHLDVMPIFNIFFSGKVAGGFESILRSSTERNRHQERVQLPREIVGIRRLLFV